MLAHVDFEGDQKVGRYGVNVTDLDRVGAAAIWRAMKTGRVVIVDEIGKVELFYSGSRMAVLEAFGSLRPVIATIKDKEEQFCDVIKTRNDVQIVYMTKENRDAVPDDIVRLLRKYLCSSTQ